MTNTQLRFVSAGILLLIVAFSMYVGPMAALLFISIMTVLCLDEIYTNFLAKKRWTPEYFLVQLTFLLPAFLIVYIAPPLFISTTFVTLAAFLNFILFVYLFITDAESELFLDIAKTFPILGSLIVTLPMLALSTALTFDSWRSLIVVMIVVIGSVDTGAWFFGRKFGKRKLWQAVSPNKTVEGLLGGVVCSSILGSLVWYLFYGHFSLLLLLFFAFLGLVGQVGDLFQSKLKRQCEIKDSSSLIPGHGGVYDRLDGLLFVVPLFILVLIIFQN